MLTRILKKSTIKILLEFFCYLITFGLRSISKKKFFLTLMITWTVKKKEEEEAMLLLFVGEGEKKGE